MLRTYTDGLWTCEKAPLTFVMAMLGAAVDPDELDAAVSAALLCRPGPPLTFGQQVVFEALRVFDGDAPVRAAVRPRVAARRTAGLQALIQTMQVPWEAILVRLVLTTPRTPGMIAGRARTVAAAARTTGGPAVSDEKWPDGLLPLASLVGALRDELRDARSGADPTLPFLVGAVTVEVNVIARREASAKFGAKFFAFLDAGVDAKAGRDTTHKLTFTLTPGDPTSADGQLRVGDKTGRPPLPSPDR